MSKESKQLKKQQKEEADRLKKEAKINAKLEKKGNKHNKEKKNGKKGKKEKKERTGKAGIVSNILGKIRHYLIWIILVAIIVGGYSVLTTDATELPLVPSLSDQELKDYYKEAMSYETIATRNTNKSRNLEYSDVDEDTEKRIKQAYKIVESQFKTNIYAPGSVISKEQHESLKSKIDDKILTFSKVNNIKQAIGYYFISVEYNVKPNSTGAFTGMVNYLGIDGALKGRAGGGAIVDEYFMSRAQARVYAYNNEILASQGKEMTIPSKENKPKVSISKGATPRTSGFDVALYRKEGGMSVAQTAFLPDLPYVYTPNAEAGNLSGYGIFPEGSFGLVDFGYNRNKLTGKMNICYVFKQNIMKPDNMTFEFAYISKYSNDYTKQIKKNYVAPDFIENEIRKTVERADRAVNNNMMSALFSREIFGDLGMGTVLGLYNNNSNVYSYMTNVIDILDSDDNRYLVDLERTIQDGAVGDSDSCTYKERVYAVIEQRNTNFVITDWALRSIEMVKAPQPNEENAELKRLAALNLRGEIDKKDKADIESLLERLYTASTNRSLDGMYECYDNDTQYLTAEKKEYLNSQLRGWLTAYGSDKASTYTGYISEWIGGAENQVEFITEEIIVYEGANKGLYINAYYLVSKYNGKWVIDDYKVINSKEVEGAELKEIVKRISE